MSGVAVGGLFEQVHSAVVETAFCIAARGVEEGSLSFGKIALQGICEFEELNAAVSAFFATYYFRSRPAGP